VNLTELAEKYGCDKLYRHSYIPFYEDLFSSMRVRRLLEIGIGYQAHMKPYVPAHYVDGASVRMWADYFPGADIFACDIEPSALINEGRVRSCVCDQSDERSLAAMVKKFGGNFDVIIDDGSHRADDQVKSALFLLPYLNEGGAYVIEDVRRREQVAQAVGGTVHRFEKTAGDCLVVVRK